MKIEGIQVILSGQNLPPLPMPALLVSEFRECKMSTHLTQSHFKCKKHYVICERKHCMFMRKFLFSFIFSIDAMKLYTLYYKYFKHDICIGYAVKSLTSAATALATQFFKKSYKISHNPGL